MIIIFDAGVFCIVLLLLVLVFFQAAASLISKCILIVCLLFALKSLIEYLYTGIYKNKCNPILCILSVLVDIYREYIFYKLLSAFALNTIHSGGIDIFLDSFSLFIVCIIGGFLFLCSELVSFAGCKKDDWNERLETYFAGNVFFSVMFLAFSFWAIYAEFGIFQLI